MDTFSIWHWLIVALVVGIPICFVIWIVKRVFKLVRGRDADENAGSPGKFGVENVQENLADSPQSLGTKNPNSDIRSNQKSWLFRMWAGGIGSASMRRGLFRLWLVASVSAWPLWLIYGMECCVDDGQFFIFFFVSPVAVLFFFPILWRIVGWIISGFSNQEA